MAKKSLLDSVEVKTPCDESWENMRGNDAVRFCSHCAKSVHNLSALTRVEARKIVAASNGKICVRYIKRPDGTLQTADRPFYQVGRRATRIAAGAFGAALALSAPAFAQGEPVVPKQEKAAQEKSAKDKTDAAGSSISGTVLDVQGAVIPGATITLTDTKSGAVKNTASNDEGFYEFVNLVPSVYKIEAESPEFTELTVTEIDIKDAQNFKKDLNMEVAATTTIVGDIAIIVEYKVEMMRAVSSADKIQLRKLISLGKDVNEKDAGSHNLSALHIAAETGDADIARILLGAKADVNITDDDGETPLMIAARDNYLEIVRLLLEAGANPHLKDNADKTAMQKTDSEEIKQLLKQYGARE